MIFSEIISQDHAVDILRKSLISGKLGHAYLFAGVDGCGKKLAAMGLVASLYCSHHTGCGKCNVCRKVMNGQHPDLHFLEPVDNIIKIEQIRELQHDLSLLPYEAPRKACIIDQAEKLNQNSGNALLKTVEEPPGNSIIILLTSNPDAVLPTIRSRCQIIRFSNIPEESIAEYLVSGGASIDAARSASARSGGSLGKALQYMDSSEAEFQNMIYDKLESCSVDNVKSIFSFAEEFAKDKNSAIRFLDILDDILRNILLELYHPTDSSNFMTSRLNGFISRISGRITDFSREAAETRRLVLRNVNPQLAVEVLLLKV